MPDIEHASCWWKRLRVKTARLIGGLPIIFLYTDLARVAIHATAAAGLALLVACVPSVCTDHGPHEICADHGSPGSGATILN